MKAGIFQGPRDIRIEEIDRPRARPEGIVVRVKAAGICGSDLHPYKKGQPPAQRIARGHESAGEVVEVGADVTDIAVGDRVWVEPFEPCYRCDWCREEGYRRDYFKCRQLKIGGIFGLHGGFAEFLDVPVAVLHEEGTDIVPSVIKLPDTLSYAEGALIEPISVGANLLEKASPSPTDTVVVLGAGIIGLGTVAQLKARPVAKVIVSDVSAFRLQAASDLGADVTVNADVDDVVARVRAETDGRGADLVVEAAGLPVTYRQAVEMVKSEDRSGTIVLVALYEEPFDFNPNALVLKGIRTIGVIEARFTESFEFMKTGALREHQVVSHSFPLEDINEAFRTAIDTASSLKVMITP